MEPGGAAYGPNVSPVRRNATYKLPGLIHFGLLTRRPRLPRKGLAQPACKIIDKVDSRAMFVEWWNARSESTSRPAGAVPSGEASERHQKMPRLVRLPGRRGA